VCHALHRPAWLVFFGTCSEVDVNLTKYKASGLATFIREDGQIVISTDFGPAFVGYLLWAMFKYGLYEVFKDQHMNSAGEELSNKYNLPSGSLVPHQRWSSPISLSAAPIVRYQPPCPSLLSYLPTADVLRSVTFNKTHEQS
jgi:hypothetical protein